jgi:hypothetical protein
MALSSPGVEVKVIDESFYTPAEPGTVPLIIVASAQDKANSSSTGTAPGTIKANAGQVYLLTSQKDLADTFGDPVFKTDANNNPIHAGEQNEYGLQAAYSLLGVSNRAYVVRADVDLEELTASATEPTANPAGGTHWFDIANSSFGIFEWNGSAITTTSGQKFVNKVPTVITDTSLLSGNQPKNNIGSIGDYAYVAVDSTASAALTTLHPGSLWYKSRGVAPGQDGGQWVEVGSEEWSVSWPTVTGSNANPTITPGHTFFINNNLVSPSGSTVQDVATKINIGINGVKAAVVNGKLEIYGYEHDDTDAGDSTLLNPASRITISAGSGTILTDLGITVGTYFVPKLQISKHTEVPTWKTNDTTPRPTGSIWVKTTNPNNGADWSVKRWNSTTLLWESLAAPIYPTGHAAIYGLDASGGGANISVGAIYVQSNYNEEIGDTGNILTANFKIFRRSAVGATTIRSSAVTSSTFTNAVHNFTIEESVAGSASLASPRTVSFTAQAAAADADLVVQAINAAGFTNIEASVDSSNRVVISHKKGGDFRLTDGTLTPLSDIGFAAYDFEPTSGSFGSGTANLRTAPTEDELNQDFIASLWHPLVYVADTDAPASLTDDGQLWYSSVIDEIDMLIHDGSDWVGYRSATSPFLANGTDPAGPIVSATTPELQSDGTALVTGDIWIDTSDIENFPIIYKFNNDLAGQPANKWVLIDKTDQTTEDGVLFADVRYNTSGANSDEPGAIDALLTSDYVDPDCPDPALYPRGMLLWNLRRSGFNVKRFERNYIDVTDRNIRFSTSFAEESAGGQPMTNYHPHRWVTESPNQADGSGSFGRKAQRAVVVKALQAVANSNQQIRDEESRVFNLIACPGYPELIGELITLNYDRGLTAFVVGDTPARLTSDATSLLGWGSNQNGALEDNDVGAASFDEYMGLFYPWGFSSDNFGNNIAVPPSHMMLRTIALNDQVAYPWFAPAGIRRGGITNATAVGYIDSEGEFNSVALNTGQRDTLYEQKINPITFFTGTGLVNYGQKTRARGASSLDRINVARLVVYLRRQLNSLAKPYIFEPNDKITRDEIKAQVESLLLELVGQRAIYDYIVVCDESNNTPSRIDRNELYIDIAIEPVKAVEFIYIPLRLKNTGEIASLG